MQIGVVEAIAAPSMIRVEFTGKGGHGGGMPMKQRCADVRGGSVYVLTSLHWLGTEGM